jgi:hypothetical protein
MSKTATVLRNSLIILALGAASAAFAADPPPATTSPPGTQKISVPYHSADKPPTPRILDLKAPDIHSVMSADEMNAALNVTDDNEVIEPETVQVHGDVPAPYVPGGFAALYWGATHPTEAWRIVAPVL